MKKFAVIIDGENISWKTDKVIISTVKVFGEILKGQIYIYGNWNEPSMKGWLRNLHKTQAIPVHVFRNGKNATDSLILMKVAEMAVLNKEVDAFCIVSSDGIYQHLSLYLRSHGKYVLGIGENKSPENWRESCDYFVKLDAVSNDEGKTNEKTVFIRDLKSLEAALEYGFRYMKRKDGWVFVAEFCGIIKKGHPDFYWEQCGGKPLEVLKKYEQETGKIEIVESAKGVFRIREKTKAVFTPVSAFGIIDQFKRYFGFIKYRDEEYYFKQEDIEDRNFALEKGDEVLFTIIKDPEPEKTSQRERYGRAINVRKRFLTVEEAGLTNTSSVSVLSESLYL